MTDEVQPNEKPKRIVRSPHNKENPYVMIRWDVLQNRKLSWAARGVLGYLLSKPDDWTLEPADLEQECGRDKVYSLLKELSRARYLERVQVVDEHGRFEDFEYHVHEVPFTPKPDTVPPDTAKPDSIHNRESSPSIDSDSNPDGLGDSKIQKPTVKSKKVKVAAAILPNGGHPSVTGVPVIKADYSDLDVNSKRIALIETYYETIPKLIRQITTPSYKGKNHVLGTKWAELGYTPQDLALIIRDRFGCDEKGEYLRSLPPSSPDAFLINGYRQRTRVEGLDFPAIDSRWATWLLAAKSHLSVNTPQSNQKVENSRDSKNALPEVAESEIDNTWALPDLTDPIPEVVESRESET